MSFIYNDTGMTYIEKSLHVPFGRRGGMKYRLFDYAWASAGASSLMR